jgi:hypothetical protein
MQLAIGDTAMSLLQFQREKVVCVIGASKIRKGPFAFILPRGIFKVASAQAFAGLPQIDDEGGPRSGVHSSLWSTVVLEFSGVILKNRAKYFAHS